MINKITCSVTLFLFIAIIAFSSSQVCLAGSDSHESNMQFLKALYNELLKRDPDRSGIATYVGGLDSGKFNRTQIRKFILESEEYKKNQSRNSGAHDSNMQFLKALYNELLRRDPDRSGIATYVGGLDSGKFTRDQIRKFVLESDEYKRLNNHDKPDKPGKPGKPDKPGIPGDPGHGNNRQQEFRLAPSSSGIIEFETSGITHQNSPACSCGWEYIFFSMFGENFRRVLLLHAGGNGRATRYFVEWPDDGVLRCERASDNLPGWHKWTVKWGGGKIEFFLDGKKIGEEKFAGRPTSCIIGGAKPSCRSFKGSWRNYSYKSEIGTRPANSTITALNDTLNSAE
jgi:hypothetical protein